MRTVLACTLGLLLAGISTSSQALSPTHIWSERFGDVDEDQGVSVAIDPAGNIIVTGFFIGTTDFGGGSVMSNGAEDIFLAKYDANGAYLWDKRFGGDAADKGLAVTTDPSGNIILTGFFRHTANFGGGPLTAAGNIEDIFLAKYDPSGAHLWSQRFGNIQSDEGADVATDAAGNIALVGFFQNTLFLGGPPLPSAGNYDIFAAKFDPTGTHLWSQRWGAAGYDKGTSIKFDSAGNLVVLSFFSNTVNFGGGPLVSAGGNDIALAKYDPSGAHLWSKRFGDTGGDVAWYVDVDLSDNIYMGATFTGSVDFGGGPLASAGSADIALAKYDATGAHQWSQRFGDAGPDVVSSVAVDNSGVAMTGWYNGTVDFGSGPEAALGSDEIYLAMYDTNGAPQWSASFGDSLSDAGNSVAMVGGGCVVATGFFQRTVDFGGGPLTSGGYLDMYLAKYCAESPVPVLISQFNAKPGQRGIDLTWNFSSDEAVAGYTIYRGRGDSPLTMIASGEARTTRSYVDTSAEPGVSYRYQLAIGTTSGGEFRSPIATATIAPAVASLEQNFPNPFNPRTTIEYNVSSEGPVSIEIFDVAGKTVRSLYQGVRKAGMYRVEWDGRDDNGQSLASGVYFYHLRGVKNSETRKMVLLK